MEPDPASDSFFQRHRMLGHYRLDSRIDAGGMGVVYRAHDTHLDRTVAIKVLPLELIADGVARKRLRKEAQVVAQLTHPNLSAVYDFDCQDGVDFLVLEYVPGTTLRDRLATGPMSEAEVTECGVQLAAALDAAHRHGVIHCDLKPANIRIQPDGQLKVLDFGLAHLRRAVATPSSASSTTESASSAPFLGGTPQYMAPELFDERKPDERTDIYGAGVSLYSMVTGRAPFQESTTAQLVAAILRAKPTPPQELNPRISSELQRIILKCLDRDPSRRYQTARELLVDLQRTRDPVTLPVQSWSSRGRIPVVVTVAVLVVASTATMWIARRDRTAPAAATMVPLVTWPGEETGGRLSPDGKWASFCATHAGRQGVWAVPTAGGEPQLLVTAAGQISSHAWSPDGEQIAVLSRDADDTYLRFVPAFGGATRASVRLDSLLRGADLTNWIGPDLYIEVARRGLFRFDTESQHATAMWPMQRGTGVTNIYFDVNPARGTVTSTRIWESNVGIAVSRLDGQDMRVVSDSGVMEFQSRWLGADGRRILYSSGRGGQIDLWQMDIDQRFATQVTFSSASERVEAASRDGSLVLMSQTEDEAHLWRVDPTSSAQRQQLTADLLQDAWPAVAQGQSRIVFQRNKPRQQGVLDVGDAQILAGVLGPTGVEDASALVTGGGCPVVSPGGKWLAYSRPAVSGGYELWVADLESRHTWRAATGFRIPDLYRFPIDWVQRMVAWSADDRTLYFVARPAGTTSEIRRLSVERDATQSAVVAQAGSGLYGDLVVSPDGQAIVCTLAHRDGRNELHWISIESGADRVLLTQSSSGMGGFICARGFLGPEPAVIVLRGQTRADFADDAEILAVPAGTEPRRLAGAQRVFAGTARLDSRRGVLYVVGIGAHDAHNVVAFDLHSGRQHRVTGNSVAGISYAGIEVLDDGDLILAEQKRNEDLMLIRFDTHARPRSN